MWQEWGEREEKEIETLTLQMVENKIYPHC